MKRFARPLIIITLGALTILVLLKLGNIDISFDTLRQIDLSFLIAAVTIHYSGFLMRGWRWQKLLVGLGFKLGYVYATALLMAGWFVSALLPARLGDVARVVMLRRDYQIPLSHGFGTIAAERALDISAILILATFSAVWALAGRTPHWVWQTIAVVTMLLTVVIAILFLVPQLETRLINLFPWTIYQKLARFGFDLLASIRELGRQPALLLVVIGQSLYIWLCDVFLMYLVFLSIGFQIPFGISAFVSMVVDLAAAVPVIPGALGQVEATAIALLSLFDIPPQQGSLMILINRFISFWTFILISGAVTYLFGFKKALNPDELQVSDSNMVQLPTE